MQDKAEAVASAATRMSYGAAGSTAAFGWTVHEIVSVSGLVLAGLTFLINWYYRHRHLQLVKQQVEQES